MKLLLINDSGEKIVMAAEDVKLINVELDSVPKEIKLGEEIIKVIQPDLFNQNSSVQKLDSDSVIAYLKDMVAKGDVSDIEKILSVISPVDTGADQADNEGKTTIEVSDNMLDGLKEIMTSINEFKKSTSEKLDESLAKMSDDSIPEASDQLQAIVTATEKATNTIMDVTEEMQESNMQINKEMTKIHEMKEKLERGLVGVINVIDSMSDISKKNDSQLIQIMEALSFQDITGQRINKIVDIVSKMDSNIKEIILDLGLKIKKQDKSTDPETIKKGEELLAMMKGPQEGGVNQSEVDDLIANFF